MSQRHVIDCRALSEKLAGRPGGTEPVQVWLLAHDINPKDVPLDSEIVIEDSAFGPVIRYTAYLRTEDGNLFVDPAAPGFAASEDRTAILRIAPDQEWLTTTGGEG
ncbi:hypothetical protein [Streptomyces sp. Amel2xC10]|uniref:hypothetical protein n=1 Tax=Streptomyces sp. Amel2xC10 TaxID=1305826 RepID=UPI000A084E94|nr:hypothetical protein [Streptomyces sp. Amel2xC10]SMF86691.1 hypothetical protein SAMN02745830_07205 [Streptomyces sp. Amel2xC10]